MSSMLISAAPLLYLNLGGEMIYILDQGLHARNIGNMKSVAILTEIIGTMLQEKVLKEFFRPRTSYNRRDFRRLFEKIIEHGRMRLNKQSIDKLFDLMLTAFKYQTLLCKEPSELVLVTINHIEGIKNIFEEHNKVDEFNISGKITYAINILMDNFGEMPLWRMAIFRSEIMNFLMGFRIKVPMMLREKRQLNDGTFVLFRDEIIEVPCNGVPPGTIQYMSVITGDECRSTEFPMKEEYKTAKTRGTTLGHNMYKAEQSGNNEHSGVPSVEYLNEPNADTEGIMIADEGFGDELKLLSALLTNDANISAADSETFELDLFNDYKVEALLPSTNKDGTNKNDAKTEGQNIQVKKRSLSKAMKELDVKKTDVAKNVDEGKSDAKQRGKSLLKMMDETSTIKRK